MKKYRFAIILAVILFFIPFFWLKPGEMNLGGDSGRLYFYDPGSYLNLRVLYNYLGSGNGTEIIYYTHFPYVALLFFIKLILQSPTMLISFFNGLTLSVAFFFVYLFVKELLSTNENSIKSGFVEMSSILAGLFYILSQISIYSGWERPITTFNQMFLNPFMAFLLLKFMLTQKKEYLISALLATFVFSVNFSLVGAPPFFAFYPITVLFLFLYAKLVRKVSFKWKSFVAGIILFLFLHAFHLVNTIDGVFSLSSSYNLTVFALQGEASRNGLDYFISVASNIKASRIWMSLAQFQIQAYFAIFIIFPAVLVVSFFLNKGKTLLFTGLFFLIVLFFASAITQTGFFFYRQLFLIPGFNMFRNFHGQWSYVFFFFYALLFGQAIAIVANKSSKRIALAIFTISSMVIIGFGTPLFTGSISIPMDAEKTVRTSFKMDPAYEQVLQYFKSNLVDGKVLMFPLTDHGYQIFKGKEGGVYKGLPTISILDDKSDFGGYETLGPFKDIFLTSIKNNDYETFKKMLSAMNIKWIFYNSDPYIYGEPFLSTLYGFVSNYSPKDQQEYKSFIEKLPINKLIDFGEKYHIYSVNDDIYFPHIYTSTDIVFTTNQINLMFDPEFQKDMYRTLLPVESSTSKKDSMIIYGLQKSFLTQIKDNRHFHTHNPFIGRALDDLFYPLVIVREKFDLARLRNKPDQYLDFSLFLLSKRIQELNRFGINMKAGQGSWQEPSPWDLKRWFSYNSWNASLVRYENAVNAIIDWIDNSDIPEEKKMLNKLKVNEQFSKHELHLISDVYDFNKEDNEKKYLLSVVNRMFERLYKKVNVTVSDPSLCMYKLPTFTNREGEYTVYFRGKNIPDIDQSQIFTRLGDQTSKTQFANIRVDERSEAQVILKIPVSNIVKEEKWSSSGVPIEGLNGITSLSFSNGLGGSIDGLTLQIPNWIPDYAYLISFDYNTNGDDFIFSFADKKSSEKAFKKVNQRLLFEKRLNAKNFKTHQSIIFAEGDTIGGFLRIVPFSPRDTSEIKIRNLKVQKIEYPELLLRKIVIEQNKSEPPQVTFTKINPTKYVLNIKGVKNPYSLIFLEQYSANWKLFDTSSNTNSFAGEISRFFGQIGKLLIGLFIKDNSKNTIVANYFNDKVKEGESKNIFIEPSTFETWGKNAVFEREHISVNGYANAWYIKPNGMGGKTDYTLILELKTQKLFYPALLLSLVTFFSLVLYLIKKLLWQKKR
ncbi:MAG: hypothetical protein ABH816_02495 [Candidatus Levyibacteriota bacterium]